MIHSILHNTVNTKLKSTIHKVNTCACFAQLFFSHSLYVHLLQHKQAAGSCLFINDLRADNLLSLARVIM